MQPSEASKSGKPPVQPRQVKEILEPTDSVQTEASAEAVIDHLKAHGADSTPVIDSQGTLLGKLSSDRISRGITGRGHDPKVTSVEPEVENEGERYCNENETIAVAEEVMREGKVDEVSVVSDAKKLVGKATMAGIEKDKREASAEGAGLNAQPRSRD
jgi:predicted transcriptional regulator